MSGLKGAGVWWGSLLVAAALGVGSWSAATMIERASEPPTMTVAEAVDHVARHGTLEHVQLVDLEVGCGSTIAGGKDAYSEGTGEQGHSSADRVWVSHFSGRPCEALAKDGIGTLHPVWPKLRSRFDMGPDDRGAILRGHDSVGWVLALALALLGIGAFGIVSGRREKRRRATNPATLPRVDAAPSFHVAEGEWLLSRPLRPNEAWFAGRRRRELLFSALGAVAVVGAVAWIIGFSVGSFERLELWNEGVEPTEVSLSSGRESEKFVFISTRLAAQFEDADGNERQAESSYFSLGLGATPVVGLRMRYDPADPTRVVFSEEVDDVWGSLALMVLGVALLSIAGLLAIGGSFSKLQALREERRVIMDDADELLLRVVSERQDRRKEELVSVTYVLALPSGQAIEHVRRPGDPPFLVDAAKNLVLGLKHPERDTVVVLGPNLEPLDVDGAETKRVRSLYRDGPA